MVQAPCRSNPSKYCSLVFDFGLQQFSNKLRSSWFANCACRRHALQRSYPPHCAAALLTASLRFTPLFAALPSNLYLIPCVPPRTIRTKGTWTRCRARRGSASLDLVKRYDRYMNGGEAERNGGGDGKRRPAGANNHLFVHPRNKKTTEPKLSSPRRRRHLIRNLMLLLGLLAFLLYLRRRQRTQQ
jgi:hypothetical protein